jgi:sialate O-acetylesterase
LPPEGLWRKVCQVILPRLHLRIASWLFGLLLATAVRAVEFAPLFNDGAVLQAGLPVNVWGRADQGSKVTVTFAGQEKTALSDEAGRWQLQLDPLEPSTEPRTLTATAGAESQAINNLVVGEVWIAAGQSNMVWPLAKSEGGSDRLARSLPLLRFVVVGRQTGLPARPLTPAQLAWKSFQPGANEQIAAVAFYFAEYLQKEKGGAIGIIQSSVGATPAEAWTPLAALGSKPELKHHADTIARGLSSGKSPDEWRREVENHDAFRSAMKRWAQTKQGPKPEPPPVPGPDNPWSSQSPAVLYENMIAPLIPYTARGVIWYQGESNAFKPDEYRILFPALIGSWREAWQRPEWPFLFVQLAAFDDPRAGRDFPGLRAAQAFTRDTVPRTGMAVAIDAGEKNDIHPKFKKPVGERLARLALAQAYGREVAARGPVMSGAEVKNGMLTVAFDHIGTGLETSDGRSEISGFEVAGPDGQFHAAAARLSGAATVAVACEAVPEPVSVRYAWADWIEPPVTLQNSDGLPAEPGRLEWPKSE